MNEDKSNGIENEAIPTPVHRVVLPVWIDNLRHMLGASKKRPGYRNCFCASVGTDDYRMMSDMQTAGFVTAGKRINSGRDQLFHATVAGCEAIGLSKVSIQRAMKQLRQAKISQ